MNRLTFKINLAPASAHAQYVASSIDEIKAEHELALSCPSVALFDLALAFSCPVHRSDRLQQVLRLNPVLLLFALDRYRYFKQTPAESALHLVAWCETNLLSVMQQAPLPICTTAPFLPEKKRQLLKRFLTANDNSSCRKALNRWIKHHAGSSFLAQSSDARKEWLERILADSFCLNGLSVRKLDKKSTLTATLLQWTQPSTTSPLPLRIQSLLNLKN